MSYCNECAKRDVEIKGLKARLSSVETDLNVKRTILEQEERVREEYEKKIQTLRDELKDLAKRTHSDLTEFLANKMLREVLK